ncbi:hypothetical protein [Pseudooceanicola batsensis]|uniref:hypothetical protein n=1 Tax=Pseudooceanicola batsensis TaxID=314255 RepID=UPI00032277BE|nr:hypothetical protein [Pseudooceanicola batsensis]
MTQTLADFWSRLDDAVHPDDLATFEANDGHGFNLDFPPPAFIGDVVNAPLIILDNNGGFDAQLTPTEFPDEAAREEYRNLLANPRPLARSARSIAPYYFNRNFSKWLEDGRAALVNGVAYRSVNGGAKHVARLSRSLPSALVHQQWLRDELLPQVKDGERFVVVHRWSRWNNAADVFRGVHGSEFSTAPISKDLTAAEMRAARQFLGE